MTGFIGYLKAYYRVCRLEYAPGEIPAIFTVLFLGSASVSRFMALPVIEALVAFILLYLSGFLINAITDKEIDSKYDTFKTSIPKSVDVFGENTIKAMVVAHVTVATILAFHISLIMSSFIPMVLVLLGVIFGIGYSVKPFKFKVRGIWHAIALGSSAFFLPFIFLIYVVAGGITPPIFLFILGFSFVHYGMEFGNQAIDYIEDRDSGVLTPPVRWGMIPSMKVALAFVVVGLVVEGSSLYYIILNKGSFTFVHPFLTTEVLFISMFAIILAGYYIPIVGLWRMLSSLKKSPTVEDSMPILKKICNYAKWQTSGIMGVAIVAGLLFFGTVMGPVSSLDELEMDNPDSLVAPRIASTPEVEFFHYDEGLTMANISISIMNGDTQVQRGSLMVMVQSWTADILMKAEWGLLERTLEPGRYWNLTVQIDAHDNDDTTFKIYALMDQTGEGDFTQLGEPWIVPSQKDQYIYEVAEIDYYEDLMFDDKADITVAVYNQEGTWDIGDLEVKIRCHTSYWLLWDEQSVQNNVSVHANDYWEPTITVNINEVELDSPIFEIILYAGGEQIDYLLVT